MIERFLVARVVEAGDLHQILFQAPRKFLRPARKEMLQDDVEIRQLQFPAVALHDLQLIDCPHLQIGNGHLTVGYPAIRFHTHGFQVARGQKHGVEGIFALVQIRIDDTLPNPDPYRFSVQQQKKLSLVLLVRMAHEIGDDVVAGCIEPVHIGEAVVVEVVHHRPRVVDFFAGKAIAVVPLLDFPQLVRVPDFLGENLHLLLREAEDVRIVPLHHGRYLEIVQRGEDALLRHPQHTCQHSKMQRRVVLHRPDQERPHKGDRLVVIAFLRRPPRLYGAVVLIQQENHLLAMIAVEVVKQFPQGGLQRILRCTLIQDVLKGIIVIALKKVLLRQVAILPVQLVHIDPDLRYHGFVLQRLDVLQGQHHHRPLPLFPQILFARLPDVRALKQLTVLLGIFHAEEIGEHTHRHGLAKAARPRNERHLAMVIQKFLDESRLVHKVALFPNPFEIRCPHRQTLLPFHRLHYPHLLHFTLLPPLYRKHAAITRRKAVT